jgi:RNA polymerase sigma-70 factor (ECF subfamily)
MSDPAASTPEPQANHQGGSAPSDDALENAFNGMRTELVSSLYFMLGNHDDAQDVAQEAFLKCWRNRDSLVEVRNLQAWIYRVALNAAKDLQRNSWRRRVRSLGDAPVRDQASGNSPLAAYQVREDEERLHQALLDLRPEEKEVFLLRQNGVLTYEEIAELRRVPVGTVKTQMRAAVAKLRQALSEEANP